MEIIYVHGFGAEKPGAFERKLKEEFVRRPNDSLTVMRWEAGSMGTFFRRGAASVLSTIAAARPRSVAEALGVLSASTLTRARREWADRQEAAKRVSDEVGRFHRSLGEAETDFVSIIGVSMGAQIIVDALRLRPNWVRSIHKLVLVSGAVDVRHLDDLPGNLLVEQRVVNMFSRRDLTLQVMYRAIGGEGTPCGIVPVRAAGVLNIDCKCQHQEYMEHMDVILQQATSLPGTLPE